MEQHKNTNNKRAMGPIHKKKGSKAIKSAAVYFTHRSAEQHMP
jgi:hypothetical protein